MSNTIVLFGGYGMLGTALREALRTYAILAPRHHEVDITQRSVVVDYLLQQRPNIVINAAAYTKVDDCEQNYVIAQQVNGAAPGFMAEAVEEIGARLIHYSTDYVFSGTNSAGYSETDQPDQPVNAYGESKLAGERAVQLATQQATIIRTAWLYGNGGQNFVDTMLQLGQEKSELKVINDQHGSPTYTVDLASATAALLSNVPSAGIVHLTNAGFCTWYDFAVEIFRLAHLPVRVISCTSTDYPRPARRPTYSKLLNTKLPPLRSWQAALADYIASSNGQR